MTVRYRALSSSLPSRSQAGDQLSKIDDDALLSLRFCDLDVMLEGTPAAALVERVYAELADRGLLFRPAVWLSEEWYNPDGVAGFAIPFYLAHPRLIRLERTLMLEAEGVQQTECLRILRHETGHAVDEAYQLFRTPEYRQVFGPATKPYPRVYDINARSRDHVMHLNAWYAQSHPVEDFAETFAVWLGTEAFWRRRYRGWPALRKLEAVNQWMQALAGRLPLLHNAGPEQELRSNERTLSEHYAEKRAFYRIEASSRIDADLARIFSKPRGIDLGKRGGRPRAARLLKTLRARLRSEIARPLGVPAYTVDQSLRAIIHRAALHDLRVSDDVDVVLDKVGRLASRMTITTLRKGRRMPL